jgi:hypothetical protein
MKVGNIVKSLDFVGIDDCYMLGKVVAIDDGGTFRAKCIKRVWKGVEDRSVKNEFFFAPQQGQHMFDRAESPRVIVVG